MTERLMLKRVFAAVRPRLGLEEGLGVASAEAGVGAEGLMGWCAPGWRKTFEGSGLV